MNSNPTTTWKHLAPNPKSAYKQLFIRGRRIRARTLYGAFMSAEEPMIPAQIAADYGLPLEAVEEAIAYCQTDPPEIKEDFEREERLMAELMNKRLHIIETNFGRYCGWYVEVDGRKVARLLDPQWEDMFWDTYRLEPLTVDPKERALLYSAEFWGSDKPVYRNCEFDEVVPFAFAGGIDETQLKETGRISMRGLYLIVPEYPWDWFLLWLRRWWNKPRNNGRLAK